MSARTQSLRRRWLIILPTVHRPAVSPDLVLAGRAAREMVGVQSGTSAAGFEPANRGLPRAVDRFWAAPKVGPLRAAAAIAITKGLLPKSMD